MLSKMMIAIALAISALALSDLPANAATDRQYGFLQENNSFYAASVREVSRSLCDKTIVLLGENGFHGDGKTIAFKAALVQRLVSNCHFKAIMFESSHYDFLAIARKMRTGQVVTADMVSSAIGGIWNHDAEMAPLIPFLLTQMTSRNIVVSGLDDQLGVRGAFYSNEQMPTELMAFLQKPRSDECHDALRKRLFYDYPANAPYSLEDRRQIQRCLQDTKGVIGAATAVDPTKKTELLQLIANIERCLARDFDTDAHRVWERDRSMYDNFRWLAEQLPENSKIIIWAANEHVAKDARSSPSFVGGRNLGSYVHEAYGGRSFALGFSAAGGTFHWSSHETRTIPVAPANSLEAHAIGGNAHEPGFLTFERMVALGALPGALFGHRYSTTVWSNVVDGVVVFRSERPPRRLDETG